MKPDSILSGQARIDVLNRIKEVEALRDRTITEVQQKVGATLQGVADIAALAAAAPADTFSAEEVAYAATILDDLDASVDSLSAQLKASIAAAKGA
jgi:NAD+--asparagine ADP-ribosyltransferase